MGAKAEHMYFGLGKLIRDARLAHQLGQDELANLLGVKFLAVSRWELSVTLPRTAQQEALARVLHLKPEQLYAAMLETEREKRRRDAAQHGEPTSDVHRREALVAAAAAAAAKKKR